MVVFSFKLLNQLRKAVAGRRYPHQMAGGVALGVLLGIIPHGNLLAAIVLFAVLCFRVNHALMTLVAVLVTLGASTHLDAYSSRVGEFVLTHPEGQVLAAKIWALPLVPWTDLNNTVVLGSFLIGLTATVPIFSLTLPIFKRLVPKETDEDAAGESSDAPGVDETQSAAEPEGLENGGDASADEGQPIEPAATPELAATPEPAVATTPVLASINTDPPQPNSETPAPSAPSPAALDAAHADETEVNVIRINDYREQLEAAARRASRKNADVNDATGKDADVDPNEFPMDEALNYLLHQLRHSQQRKAAG